MAITDNLYSYGTNDTITPFIGGVNCCTNAVPNCTKLYRNCTGNCTGNCTTCTKLYRKLY